MLNNSDVNPSRLLERSLIVPVRINLTQSRCQTIVLSRQHCVHTRQHQLLVHPDLTSLEAVHALIRSGATLVRNVQLQWQQILQTVLGEHRIHSKQTSIAGTQLTRESFLDAVDRVSIDDSGKSVELIARSQFAAGSGRRKGANKVEALDVEQPVEVVIVRNADLVAVRVLQVERSFAALFGVVSVDWV